MSGPNGNFQDQQPGGVRQPPNGWPQQPPQGYGQPGFQGPPQGWQPQPAAGWSPPPPKKKTGLIVGVVVGVVVLALLGVGGWYLVSRAQAARELAESDTRSVEAAVSAIDAIGRVDLDAEGRIVTAEKKLDAVREEVRGEVSNRGVLTSARGELGAQLSELTEAKAAVDAWREVPTCQSAEEAQAIIAPLNPSQVSRLDGGDQDVLDAVATCEKQAEEERLKAEQAEKARRANLFKVSNYWFEETGKGEKGCVFQVTPEFTNLSPTETFKQVVVDVIFYNPDGSTALDMAGVTTQTLTIAGPVAPGKLHRAANIKVNYDCGIDSVRIERVAIDYASGGHDDLGGAELQYGSEWTKS